MNKADNLIKQAELKKEAESLVSRMFDTEMNDDEIIEMLSSVVNKEGFKRFVAEKRREMEELSYPNWREKNYPGWYLSDRPDESYFEEYLDYLHENNYDYDMLNPTQSSNDDKER